MNPPLQAVVSDAGFRRLGDRIPCADEVELIAAARAAFAADPAAHLVEAVDVRPLEGRTWNRLTIYRGGLGVHRWVAEGERCPDCLRWSCSCAADHQREVAAFAAGGRP